MSYFLFVTLLVLSGVHCDDFWDLQRKCWDLIDGGTSFELDNELSSCVKELKYSLENSQDVEKWGAYVQLYNWNKNWINFRKSKTTTSLPSAPKPSISGMNGLSVPYWLIVIFVLLHFFYCK